MTTRVDVLQIRLESTGDGRVKASLAEVSAGIEKIEKAADGAARESERFKNVGAALGTVLSATALATFAVVREVERLRSVLTTLEGSQAAAAERFRELRDLAAETPNSVTQMVEAYSILRARGLDPTREALLAYANVSAATGKTVLQFIEAVADAATGEFERLKEFGIIARSAGDQVQFTFRGVTETVGKNAQEIEAYLQRIGSVQFAGAAAQQMDTLNGAISNLLDNVSTLLTAVGDSGLTGVLTLLVQAISEGVVALTEMIDRTGAGTEETGLLGQALGVASVAIINVIQGVKLLGASMGAYLDVLGAMRDGLLGLGSAALSFAQGMASIQSGNYAAALVQLRQGYEEATQGVEAANQRVTIALTVLRDTAVDLFGPERQAMIDKALALFGSTGERVAKGTEQGATGLRTLTGEQQKQIDATEKQIAALQRQVDTFGMSQEALIEYNRAQQLASAGTAEQRDRINALTDALLRKMRQQQELEKSTERFVARMRELATATADFTRLESELARQFEGPSAAAARTYAEALQQIAEYERELLQLGPMAADEAQRIAAARQNAARAYEVAQRQAVEAAERAAIAQMSAAERVLMQGAEDLSAALTDALLSGDWEDVGERLAKSLIGGMLESFLRENLTGPLQQALMGNTGSGGQLNGWGQMASWFTGQGFETRDDFVGPPSQLANNSSGSQWGQQAGQMVQGAAVGYAIGGELFGGSKENQNAAAIGAAIGTYIMPGIGTIIGAVLGAVVGELFERKPTLEVSDNPANIGRTFVRGSAESELGRIYVGDRNNPLDGQKFADTVAALDNAIARLFTEAEKETARAALRGFDVDQFGNKQIDPEAIISLRVNRIIAAVEPAFAAFLAGIEDIEERLVQFEALRNLRTWVDSLDDAIAELDLSGDPVSAVLARISQAEKQVTQAGEALADALMGTDAAAVQQAGANAVNAVVARYQMEIAMVEELERAILQVQREARALNLQLEQRIAALTGDSSGVTAQTFANLAVLRTGVDSARTPEQAMAFLDEFVATVDTWLQSAISDVQRLAEAERARVSAAMEGIQMQLTALSDERASIMAGAQARAQAQQQANQAATAAARAAAQAAEEARRAQIEALQEQLRMAQQWMQVVEQAGALMDSLNFSAANPLDGFGRLALLDARIRSTEELVGSASGEGRVNAARELLELLQQRLQLVQSEGLMDRPSGQYLDLFNQTLRQIADVQAIAQPEADQAANIQAQIAALQQSTITAIDYGTSVAVQLSAQEQARLDEIAAEEAVLQAELLALQEEMADIARREEAAIQALKDEAVGYYRWAQGEAARLQAEQAASLEAQLDAITGGRPIDQFLAERAADTVALLTDIKDDLREFLTSLSTGFVPVRPGGPGFGGGGTSPGGGDIGEILVKSQINITGASGDPKAIADAVQGALNAQLPQFATRIKREMDYS